MAQWLGFWAFTAMARLQSLVWELRSHKPRGMAKTTTTPLKNKEKTGKILSLASVYITFMYEAPILWSPDTKSQLIGKDPDVGKDWKQKEKGAAEDKMVI